MRIRPIEKDETRSCCQEMDGVCYHLMTCDRNEILCISDRPRCSICSETDDTDDEIDRDVFPETNTQIFRMPRRGNNECIVDNLSTLSQCCNGKQQCQVRVNKSNQFCREGFNSLEITYSCVKKNRQCPSISTSMRPGTSTATTFTTSTSPKRPEPSSTTTSTPTSILTTTPVSSSVSTSPVQPNPRMSPKSTTGSTPNNGIKDELSILDSSSIVGIAVGSLGLLVLIILIAIILYRKRKGDKMENNQSPNVYNKPHYFAIEAFPNNQYEEIHDVDIPNPNNDYNTLGEDNSVKLKAVNNYNHISPANIEDQVGLTNDGYNHIVLAKDNSSRILDNDYNHIKVETDDYNQLRGHNSFKNPKADNYHHILSTGDNEGNM